LERRARELLADLERAEEARARLQDTVAHMSRDLATAEATAAAQRAHADSLRAELGEKRTAVRSLEDEVTTLARRVDAAEERASRAQTEARGALAAMAEARTRHADALARERDEILTRIRHQEERATTKANTNTNTTTSSSSSSSSSLLSMMTPTVRGVLGEVRSAFESAAAAKATESERTSRVSRALERYEQAIIAAEQAKHRAESETRVARIRASLFAARLTSVEAAYEERLSAWEISEAARAAETAATRSAGTQRVQHLVERLELSRGEVRRLEVRDRQAADLHVELDAQRKAMEQAMQAAEARATRLERTVQVTTTTMMI
jgi:predicted ribosome quality control (RQC) complex YloA/Tae2 family protein